ncbi:MAG TPA: polysaccharide biosynthesis tyrosine autokinase [Gemmatimonadales bacterium]|nr:polysaccharide biosynthesis tyrosine autokinase [Gemmatimonadales bacterium]HYR97809.1 polysaccharide biosynthesis tyrosine autokinase [Gemmatimonadales bacterium]
MTSDDHLPARFDDETSPPLLTSGTRQAVARAAPGEPDSLDEWGRYLRAVRRHKWLVLGATLLGAAAGVALAVLAVQPTYVARATVWVQVPAARYGREPGPIWSGQLPISSGWAELLRTNIVLEDVVRRQRLYLAHEQPGDSDLFATFRIKQRVHPGKYRLVVDDSGKSATLSRARNVVEHVAVGDSVGAALGFAWVPPAAALWPRRNAEFTVLGPGDAAKDLGRDLKMSADIDGNFVRLELHGPEPSAVTGTVNAIAERFVATAADLKRNNLVQLTEILSAQLERARANLRDAETALKTFRVKAVTQYADGAAPVTPNLLYPRDPAFAGLLDLKVNREGMLRDREAIGRILAASGDSTLAIDALGMIGSVQKSTELSQALRDLTARQAELRALRVHYTDAAPEVRRLAAEVAALERKTIPMMAAALTEEMGVRAAELQHRVDSATGDLRRVPPLAVEEVRLQRDVTLAEQIVANLQQRYEEAHLAEVSSLPDVRLVDPAMEPQAPAGNWGALVIMLALIAGGGLGVAGAVVLDHTDRHVHYPEDVTGTMGLNILGVVPHLARNGHAKRHPEGVLQVLEAVRGIRLNVLHAHGVGPAIVTVTSPGRADGKSFLSSNLAVAFADAGYRTLLIDGDVRCGRLHRVLKLPRKPGLTDVLAGQATIEQVVQATTYRTLSFIASGTRTHGAPALVSSAALPRMLAGLRPHHDAIIVDSSPLAAGADAFALGTASGSMVLVLRTGVSDRDLAQTKLEVLDHLPIRLLGAVVNDVRPGGAYGYYSYYLEGYEAKDEPAGAAGEVLRGPE